jgi:histone-lysine N-methyltransferase SETMAR
VVFGEEEDPGDSPPPYSPNLAPADYFLFPTLKRELAGLSMSLDEFKTKWEGVVRTLIEDDFARAFERWQHRCEKCVSIGGGCVKKVIHFLIS